MNVKEYKGWILTRHPISNLVWRDDDDDDNVDNDDGNDDDDDDDADEEEDANVLQICSIFRLITGASY